MVDKTHTIQRWTHVLLKDRQILLPIAPFMFLCLKSSNKLWGWKEWWVCEYNKHNIFVVIWYRYCIMVNQVIVSTVKLAKWWLQLLENLGSIASLPAVTFYQKNPDRNYQLCHEIVDPYSISKLKPHFIWICECFFLINGTIKENTNPSGEAVFTPRC